MFSSLTGLSPVRHVDPPQFTLVLVISQHYDNLVKEESTTQTLLLYILLMKSFLSSSFSQRVTGFFLLILLITLGICQPGPPSGILFHTLFADLPFTWKNARILSVSAQCTQSSTEESYPIFLEKDIHTPISNYPSDPQLPYSPYLIFVSIC